MLNITGENNCWSQELFSVSRLKHLLAVTRFHMVSQLQSGLIFPYLIFFLALHLAKLSDPFVARADSKYRMINIKKREVEQSYLYS